MNAPEHSLHQHNQPKSTVAVGPAGVVFTCPMHPEIRHIGPGNCPKCGMALEPLLIEPEADTAELDDMTRRLWVSAALTLPLLFVTMGEFVPGLSLHRWLGIALFNWSQ